MDLAVLLENRFPPVRVRGRGDFIFDFICFYCFVMNEVFLRFGELWSIQGGSGTRYLQFESGPRPSNKQIS